MNAYSCAAGYPTGLNAHMRQRLNLILVGVKDVQRSVDFYQGLGWKKSNAGSEEFVLFDLGGIALGIQSREAFAKDAGFDDQSCSGFPGFAFAYIAKCSEDVYRIMLKAEDLGANIMKPAQSTNWGHAGYFRDLDGHLFEVVYEDGWKFNEDDNLVL
jgi:predicted lactoylglutathione lyase